MFEERPNDQEDTSAQKNDSHQSMLASWLATGVCSMLAFNKAIATLQSFLKAREYIAEANLVREKRLLIKELKASSIIEKIK